MTDNSTEMGDVQLIHAWINGDARAFDMLYDRYKQPLYGYLHNLFRGENANIDDIFQRTWLKVIEHLPKYQDQEKFSAWLMRIAGNLAIDFFRSRKRRSEEVYDDRMEAVLPAPPSAAPDAEIRRQELIDATAVAVTELAPEIRQVFLLRKENIPFREIAEIQQCSINTCLARMQYALKSLRRSLAPWMDHQP